MFLDSYYRQLIIIALSVLLHTSNLVNTEKFYLVEWECDGSVTTVEEKHIQCDKLETVVYSVSYPVPVFLLLVSC